MLKDTEKASPPSHQEHKDSPEFNLVLLGAPLVSLVSPKRISCGATWWFAVSSYLAT
jgi:hypothetical protein